MWHHVTITQYTRKIAGTDRDGPSPGGAARDLGISRQAVHNAIQRGDLEAYRITNRRGDHIATVVSEASIKAYTPRQYPRRA